MLPNPWAGDWVLPRHGIARTAQFTAQETWNSFALTLDRNQHNIENERYSLFPHDFVYDLSYEFMDHGCTITQQILNPKTLSPTDNSLAPKGIPSGLKEQQILKMWFGLHPYFPTPNSITQVRHGVESDLFIDHHNDDTQVLKNPWAIKLVYPWYNLIIEYSDIYQRVWIWAPPWHDAICIEPVTHDVWEYFDSPIIVRPWGQITGTMKLMIETKD
jgi:galactose mutarotase-like enzyme